MGDREALTVQELGTAGDTDVAWTAADTDGHYFLNDGNVVLLMKNASGGGLSIVIDAMSCSHGFSDDLTFTVGAGKVGAIGPFKPELYNQITAGSLGRVHFSVADATSLTFAAIRSTK